MKWNKREAPASLIREIAAKYKLDLLYAAVLARRGIVKPEELLFYLEKDLRFLHNPFLFRDMEDAVDRVLLAIDEQEKILIFGDRDTDGVSATVLLYEALKKLQADVSWDVPCEEEKYGLSIESIDRFADEFGSLIITVDCGISNFQEIAHARELGIDVIILDHHEAQGETLPSALAIINPKVANEIYPFRDLSGCGVVFKFLWALRFAHSNLYKQNFALLNIRPLNDAYSIDIIKIENLVEKARLSEVIVPGTIPIEKTRLLPFLKDSQILVWDGAMQGKLLEKALGKTVEVCYYDIQPDIARVFPQTAGLSLLRLTEISKIDKYTSSPGSEIDTFFNLFISYSLKASKITASIDSDELQLVALSTIADLMPLKDENRLLVKAGLEAIALKPRKGLLELMTRQSLLNKQVSARDISWQITPIINAAGRMGNAKVAVELFIADTIQERTKLVETIVSMNTERRQLASDTWLAFYEEAMRKFEESEGKFIIIGSEKISRGIAGIVASKLADTFKVPAVAASFSSDGTATGSVRTSRGLNVKGLLDYCADLFTDYGGHEAAAGFSLKLENWKLFEEKAGEYLYAMDLDEHENVLEVDAELPLDYVTADLIKLNDFIEPCGEGNPAPVFFSRNVMILNTEIVGKSDKLHLKLTLDFLKNKWPALWWGAAEEHHNTMQPGKRIDVFYRVQRNVWNGIETLQLIILHAELSQTP